MSFHAGNLDTCARLQKLYRVLKRGPKTSLQLARLVRSVAISTDLSALRANLKRKPRDGYTDVSCTQRGRIYTYSLARG